MGIVEIKCVWCIVQKKRIWSRSGIKRWRHSLLTKSRNKIWEEARELETEVSLFHQIWIGFLQEVMVAVLTGNLVDWNRKEDSPHSYKPRRMILAEGKILLWKQMAYVQYLEFGINDLYFYSMKTEHMMINCFCSNSVAERKSYSKEIIMCHVERNCIFGSKTELS